MTMQSNVKNALIPIQESEKFGQTVSARILWQFLEVKKDFSDWIKHRIKKYGLIENQDFASLPQIGENPIGGRPTIEYALTLDAAKELAMVEGNAKGKEARQYFIEIEKQHRASQPLSQAEMFLHSAQVLVQQEKRLQAIEKEILQIKEERNKAVDELLLIERSTSPIPAETTRIKIRKIINQYCFARNADHQSVWHVIYERLYYLYGINLRIIVKNKGESTLDVAERLGHLETIYNIVSSELN